MNEHERITFSIEKNGVILFILFLVAIGISLLLMSLSVLWSPLNQDEGWYLLAARRVSQGLAPYIDFAFTQGPVMPRVYSLIDLWVVNEGMLAGRIFTATLALITLGCVLFSSAKDVRKDPPRFWFAFLLAACLLGLNAFHAQYTSTVKTYSLAGGLLVLGAICFTHIYESRRWGWLWAILAAQSIAFAAGTRLSLGVFFIPMGLALVFASRKIGHKAWVSFAASGLIALAVMFVHPLVVSPENLFWGVVEFHTHREVSSPMLLKAGFLSRFVQNYLVLCGLIVGLVFHRCLFGSGGREPDRGSDEESRSKASTLPLWLGLGLCSLIHFSASFPYDDYQVALIPLAVVLVSQAFAYGLPQQALVPAGALTLLFSLAFAWSSPVISQWFVVRQDRIWFETRSKPALFELRDTARQIREGAPDARSILTQDLYLAIETGLRVPLGFEMGPFSFTTELDDRIARDRHLMTEATLAQLLERNPPDLAALSGYAFALNSPQIQRIEPDTRDRILSLIQGVYAPAGEVQNFGQHSTRLTLWTQKVTPSAPSIDHTPESLETDDET